MRKPRKPKSPAAAIPPVTPGEVHRPQGARKACYDKILWELRQGFATYAEAHPERVGDARWEDGLECSMDGLARMVAVIEGFDVEWPGTVETLQEELRRLRATCADLRLQLEARTLGNGDEGEDP